MKSWRWSWGKRADGTGQRGRKERKACLRLKGKKEMVTLESSQVGNRPVFCWLMCKLQREGRESFNCRHVKTKEEHGQENQMGKWSLRRDT